MLTDRGVSTARLKISEHAHVIMPWHRLLDSQNEVSLGSLQIGSTATQGFLDLSAVDSLVLADLAAQGQISLASDGSITAGNVTTGQSLVLAANRPGATLTTDDFARIRELAEEYATTWLVLNSVANIENGSELRPALGQISESVTPHQFADVRVVTHD